MTAITYTLSGGATGANVTGLPPGVTSSVAGNVVTISGSPTTIAGSPFNYSITTTGNNCVTASANGSISVLLTPTVQFNSVAGICADVVPFNLSGIPAGGTFSGTGVNAGGLFTPSVAGAGNHTIRYTYVAANGCSNFAEQIIPVYPLPVVDAGPDKGLIEGGQVTLTPNVTANFNITYLWTPPQYLSNPAIRNPVVSNIPADQVYQLTVTSDNGCSANDFVNVKLLKKIEVPNIFSPNGDGVHDTWVIPYLDSYPGNTVEVFNRYGQRIFYSEGYGKPWDGTVNGKQVPVGTYYFIITPKNGRLPMAGYVDIIR
jgi:gliding motility-associated-like protein